VGTTAAVILRLSLGLAILYGLVIVVWYELVRSAITHRRAAVRRRGDGPAAEPSRTDGRHDGRPAERVGEAPADRAAMESELERARGHYRLAREEARAERDTAIASASRAAEQAIERIEARYREIDGAFTEEETERILEMLRRPPSGEAP
jgi:hypothetical protein